MKLKDLVFQKLGERRNLCITLAFVFVSYSVMTFIDVLLDLGEGSTFHILLEVLLFGLSMTIAWIFLSAYLRLHRVNSSLETARIQWKQESEKFRRGLSESIDHQLSRWSLTPAEKEVALLLLKGLSHKEVAQIRDTSEKTTRQQALSIYQKSGIPGRAELSAFFLEDLLDLPATQP